MQFQSPLQPARLLRRHKRFLADIELPDGGMATAHCANPGAMTGLAEAGTKIWVEPNDDPRKKLKFAWRLVEHEDGHFTGIDTSAPNRLIRGALVSGTLARGAIPALAAYSEIRPEQNYGEKSRIDFLALAPDLPPLYIEVKSVTLRRSPSLAEFPDTKTARGARHLLELTRITRQGARAMVIYVVQRTDCTRFSLAADIDPNYASAAAEAHAAGVSSYALACDITPDAITLKTHESLTIIGT